MGLHIERAKTRRNNLILTIMSVFAFVLQPLGGLISEGVASAVGGSTITYNFDNYDGSNSWGSDWTFSGSGIDAYKGNGTCGLLKNCVEFSKNNDSATLTLPAGKTASSLNFFLRQSSAGNEKDSSLELAEYNGDTKLSSEVFMATPQGEVTLEPSTNKLVFTMQKVGNNLALDDVVVTVNTPVVSTPTVQPCTTTSTIQTTDLSTWNLSETRANGHNTLTANGLHVWTDSNTSTDKAAGYYPASFDLADLGAGFGVTTSSGSGTLPSLQLLVDLNDDGLMDGYLVGEPVSYGADSLWLSSNWHGIDLSAAPTSFNGGGTGKGGSANAWLAAFPNAKVSAVGYSLGSGVHGDYVISNIFAGCTNYTFKALPPQAPQNLVFSRSDTNATLGQMNDGDGTNAKPTNTGTDYIWAHWDNDAAVDYQITTYFQNTDGTWAQLHNSSPIKPTPYRFYGFGDEGEGVYRFRVAAYNPSTGLTSAYTNATLLYDHSSPVAHFTAAPDNNSFVNGNFTVAGVASDNVKLKNVIFDVRDANGWVAGCVAGTMQENYSADQKSATPECTINTANLQDGHTYTLRIHTGDYAGYGGGESRTITIDRTLPVVQIDGTAPKLTYKLTDGLGVHVIDSNFSNVDVNRTDLQAPSNDKHWNYTGAWFGLSWLKDGTYDLIAHDKAGNSTTVSFTTDRTKPHVDGAVSGAFTNNGVNYNPANVKLTATDDIKAGWFNSGIKAVTGNIYKVGQSGVFESHSSTTQNPFTVDLTALADGQYYIRYNASDNVGNISNTEEYYFTVDHTAPTGTITYSNNNGNQLTNKDVTATLTTDEDVQDISGWTRSDTNSRVFTKVFTDNGKFSVTFSDYAGNAALLKGEIKRIDRQAPQITGVSDGDIVNHSVQLTVFDPAYEGAFGFDANHGLTVNGSEVKTTETTGHYFVTNVAITDDGDYTVVATDKAGNSTTVHFTIDTVAPTAPTILTPTQRQWFKDSPIKNSWTAAVDTTSGIKTYQVAYQYDDGHTFANSTCDGVTFDGKWAGCRDTGTATSRNHGPSLTEQGGVTIWVRAIDNADNVGAWSKSVHYYYDHEDPTTNLQISPVVNGKFTVTGDASDNLALNRVYVQLVNREDGHRYGGTTINLIASPFSTSAHWSQTYDLKALGYPDGTYAANVAATDMAGNTYNPGWSADFTVSTLPTLTGDYFAAKAGQLNVGFHVGNLFDATKVSVALFDATDQQIAENTGDSADMLNLLNGGMGGRVDVSSPFYVPSQADDGWWNFGTPDWKAVNKPSYAVVTVTYGSGATLSSDHITLTSPSDTGETWEGLIAALPGVGGQDDTTAGGQTNAGRTPRTIFTPTTTTPGIVIAQTANQGRSVLGASDNNADGTTDAENGSQAVKGAYANSYDKGCFKIFGICWYWTVAIAVVVAAIIWWIIAAARRRNSEA